MKITPPQWADGFLRWYCDRDLLEDIQGDLYELYHCRIAHSGKKYADIRFVWEVLRLIRLPLLKNPFRRDKKIAFIVQDNQMNRGTMVRVLTVQAWDDILFESRNKDYGAYRIRTSYGGNMLVGFSVVLLISTMIVLWWWIQFKY